MRDDQPTILFVDDETYILNALKRVFITDHYRIFTAESAEMALDILEHEEISVVVSDLNMPKMNGIEFLGEVQKQWPDIPKLLLTGMADVEDTVAAINSGRVYGFINKPWDNDDLRLKISQAADKYDLEKKNKHLQRLTSFQNKKLKSINNNLKMAVIDKDNRLHNVEKELEIITNEEKEHLAALSSAEKENREKRRFLATMSHEIRSPLNSVIAMNSLLLETPLNEEQEELARMAKEGGQILLSLINDILDFSRIEAGFLELEESWFDLVDTIYTVADILSSLANKKNIVLICIFHPDTPHKIYGDAVRFKQILINIVNNAIKFTNDGGVKITVEPHFEKGVVIKVTDTGIGISENKREAIFNEFEQESNGDDRKYEGTGLGLSIVKKIMDVMKANIYLKSEKGVGSEFLLEFPFNSTGHVNDLISLEKDIDVHLSIKNTFLLNALIEQFTMLSIPIFQMADFSCRIDDDRNHILLLDGECCTDEVNKYRELFQTCLSINHLNIINISIKRKLSLNESLSDLVDKRLLCPFSIQTLSEILNQESKPLRESDSNLVNDWHLIENCFGKRILVAEDSIANQGVISAILDSTPIELTMASNGCEAYELAKQEQFDLILMDLRMPKMDGLEATRLIRQSSLCIETPIMAMTANAFTEDRERCFAAGMNDYLSKPVDIDKFRHKLEKWLIDPSSDEQSNSPITTSSYDSGERHGNVTLINFPTVDALLKDTSPESIKRIYTLFFEENTARVQAMCTYFSKRDYISLADEAHTLKSSAGSFGAEALFLEAKNLEIMIKQNKEIEVEKIMASINELSQNSMTSLKNYIEKKAV